MPVPLAARMRPRNLNEIVGQQHLLTPGSVLHKMANQTQEVAVSIILYGPPGTGKTTIAQAIAETTGSHFVKLSAIDAGIAQVRQVMKDALNLKEESDTPTMLFVDEVHRFDKKQQDALLPGVEAGTITLIAATTENPSFAVNKALVSRSLILKLEPIEDTDLGTLLQRAMSDTERGLGDKYTIDPEARSQLIRLASGDARALLNRLEACTLLAQDDHITVKNVEDAVGSTALSYDRDGDQHYDVVSAWIKSMRGSDPDAALHYLALMLSAGEDPRFISRRLMIHAAEDVGMADPSALQTATAAHLAVSHVGMPEAQLILGMATIHIATSPKSNASYKAIGQAMQDVAEAKHSPVPPHLRDAHYKGAQALGHGVGYLYPHDYSQNIVRQQYMPDSLVGTSYYQPTNNGYESKVRTTMEFIRNYTKG